MYTPNRAVNQALSAAAVGKTLLKRGGYARTVPLARATQYIGANKSYIRMLTAAYMLKRGEGGCTPQTVLSMKGRCNGSSG